MGSAEDWDAEAATFDEAADHGLRDPGVREAWRRLLTGALPPAPGRVADLGCGTGTLTLLLAEAGYEVDGVDVSPAMLGRARTKAADRPGVTFTLGDAADPPLPSGRYDVVLSRHVLWALPDPASALNAWVELLRPAGRLVLVEGHWSTGAGLTAEATTALCRAAHLSPRLQRLADPDLWGRRIDDERYLVVARRAG